MNVRFPPLTQEQAAALGPILDFLAYDEATGCWLWTGDLTRRGMPPTDALSMVPRHHTIAGEIAELIGVTLPIYGTLPVACGTPACVNPAHHQWVEPGEYMAWIAAHAPDAGKCRKGHLIVGDNCYTAPDGTRFCVVCRTEREKNRKPRPKTRTVVKWRAEGVLIPAPDDWSAPATVVMRRYQCPGCRRTFGKMDTAKNHMKTCFKLPLNRACRTCVNFHPGHPGSYEEPPEDASCLVGVEFGVTEKGTTRLVLHCEKWDAKP